MVHTLRTIFTQYTPMKGKANRSSPLNHVTTRGNELRNERVVRNFLELDLQLNSHDDSSNPFLMPCLDESDKTL